MRLQSAKTAENKQILARYNAKNARNRAFFHVFFTPNAAKIVLQPQGELLSRARFAAVPATA